MKKLSRVQVMNIIGGKLAPPPCSICNDPNESPNTNQIATYYHEHNGCYMGGGFVENSTTVCVFYTTQYSCPNSGLNPNAGGLCGPGGGTPLP